MFAGKGCKSCGVENLIPQFFGAVLGVFIGPKLIISGWSAPPGVFTQQTYSGSAAGWSPESAKPFSRFGWGELSVHCSGPCVLFISLTYVGDS